MPSSFVPSRDLLLVPQLRKRLASGDMEPREACEAIATGLCAVRRACGFTDEGVMEEWVWEPPEADAGPDRSAPHVESLEDTFETQYARDWLHAVINWVYGGGGAALDPQLDGLAEACSAHLVLMAGQSAAGARERLYRFFTSESPPQRAEDAAATVQLREIPLVDDALGGRTWGAAPFLARRMMLEYARNGVQPRTVLELGAGTGLVGLALAAWFRNRPGQGIKVVLTDYHPTVLSNLQENCEKNAMTQSTMLGGIESQMGVRVFVAKLDWREVYEGTVTAGGGSAAVKCDNPDAAARQGGPVPRSPADAGTPFSGNARFDVLVAAGTWFPPVCITHPDCVYERDHARWIAAVARRHLRRPAPEDAERGVPQLHILSAIRPTHQEELVSVYAEFGDRAAPASALRIVSETDMVGPDDFGPATIAERGELPHYVRQGRSTVFRHFVVQWSIVDKCP